MERRLVMRLLSLTALILLGLARVPATLVPTADGTVFIQPDNGYSITIPPGWDVLEHDGDHDVVGWCTIGSLRTAHTVGLSVTSQHNAAGNSLDDMTQSFQSSLPKLYANLTLVNEVDGTMCGLRAKAIIFNGFRKGEYPITRQYTAYVFKKDDLSYIVEYDTVTAYVKADANFLRDAAMTFCFDTTRPARKDPPAPTRTEIPNQCASVIAPDGWRITLCDWSDPRRLGLLQRKLTRPIEPFASMAIGMMYLPASGYPEARISQFVRDRLRMELPIVYGVETGTTTIAGHDFPWVRGYTVYLGRPVTSQTYYVVDGKRVLLMISLTPRGAEEMAQKDFTAIITSLEVQADPASLPPPPSRRTWNEEGFSLVPPQGWIVSRENWERMPSKVINLTRPRAMTGDHVYETLYVYVDPLEVASALDDYVGRNKKTLAATLPDYKELGTGDVTINGAKAKWVMYSTTVDGLTLAMVRYILLDNNRAFVITSSATPDTYAKYKKTFEEVVASFKVEK